jgi:hypothetical protein
MVLVQLRFECSRSLSHTPSKYSVKRGNPAIFSLKKNVYVWYLINFFFFFLWILIYKHIGYTYDLYDDNCYH